MHFEATITAITASLRNVVDEEDAKTRVTVWVSNLSSCSCFVFNFLCEVEADSKNASGSTSFPLQHDPGTPAHHFVSERTVEREVQQQPQHAPQEALHQTHQRLRRASSLRTLPSGREVGGI
jgi:hypothetical protein